jgi:hypothetical protein
MPLAPARNSVTPRTVCGRSNRASTTEGSCSVPCGTICPLAKLSPVSSAASSALPSGPVITGSGSVAPAASTGTASTAMSA